MTVMGLFAYGDAHQVKQGGEPSEFSSSIKPNLSGDNW
jgi:hypothetical protein